MANMYQGRFSGRTAVITGGAAGLGLQTARRMVQEGARVTLWDIDAQKLSEAQKEIGAHSIQALDVSDAVAVAQAAIESRQSLGKIDILVASAGITGRK